MLEDPIDAIIDSPPEKPRQRDEPGWTAWVEQKHMPMRGSSHDRRPWCRGRASKPGLRIHWFPRTSKMPKEGERWAVYSPPDHLPKLGRKGWFAANAFVTRLPGFEPASADPCGVLPAAYVTSIYDRLRNFFRDRYSR